MMSNLRMEEGAKPHFLQYVDEVYSVPLVIVPITLDGFSVVVRGSPLIRFPDGWGMRDVAPEGMRTKTEFLLLPPEESDVKTWTCELEWFSDVYTLQFQLIAGQRGEFFQTVEFLSVAAITARLDPVKVVEAFRGFATRKFFSQLDGYLNTTPTKMAEYFNIFFNKEMTVEGMRENLLALSEERNPA